MKAKKNKFILVILAVYGIILLYALFFSRIGADYPRTYTEYLNAMHNFIPFKSVYELLTAPALPASVVFRFALNFFGNILLFILWGVLLPARIEQLRSFTVLQHHRGDTGRRLPEVGDLPPVRQPEEDVMVCDGHPQLGCIRYA